VTFPPEFEIHSHLKKHHVENRLKKLEAGSGIDWGTAEALAIGSLLYQVHSVFTDLDKLNLVKVAYGFRFRPLFATAPAAAKNDACFKGVQNRLEYYHDLLVYIRDTFCMSYSISSLIRNLALIG